MTSAPGLAVEDCLPAECVRGQTLWIDGFWRAAVSGERFDSVDPSSGMVLLQVAKGKAEDVDLAVKAAETAAGPWGEMDGIERGRVLRRAAEALREHRNALGLLDSYDGGRPIRETTGGSVEGAARLFDFYAGLSDKIHGSVIPMGPGKTGIVEREPYGVVGAISPWNYPLNNAATKIAPILACGNALVLKPAEQTPLSVLLLAEIFSKAGLPKGVLNVVTGLGTEAGAALVDHPAVPKLSFTGSTTVGRRIAAAAGERLKSVTLELGGKSPLIVFGDADLKSAAAAAVFSVFMNQGQTCTACTRVLVSNTVVPRFLELCREEAAKLHIGDPLDPATQIGPLVSVTQVNRVRSLIEDGVKSGGKRMPLDLPFFRPIEGGCFLEPTIVTDVDPRSRFAKEEIFGPVMTLYSFNEDGDAYRLANDTDTVWRPRYGRARCRELRKRGAA